MIELVIKKIPECRSKIRHAESQDNTGSSFTKLQNHNEREDAGRQTKIRHIHSVDQRIQSFSRTLGLHVKKNSIDVNTSNEFTDENLFFYL